jgi:hypothetical protein
LPPRPPRSGGCPAGSRSADAARPDIAALGEALVRADELGGPEARDAREVGEQLAVARRVQVVRRHVRDKQPRRFQPAHLLVLEDPAMGDGLAPVAVARLREPLVVQMHDRRLRDVGDGRAALQGLCRPVEVLEARQLSSYGTFSHSLRRIAAFALFANGWVCRGRDSAGNHVARIWLSEYGVVGPPTWRPYVSTTSGSSNGFVRCSSHVS